LASTPGPSLLEVRIGIGSREDLGRPTSTPEQNKRAFMDAARA
jgi:phosphonopyruvate decarboxylase